MKIAIYSPYLDILGGGERYVLTMGHYWAKDHQVDVFWGDRSLKEKLHRYLNLDLKRVNFVDNIFRTKNLLERSFILSKYDILIYVTDGSLFFSPVKRNLLVIQSPAHCPGNKNFLNRIKFRSWSTFLCYSLYVKNIIDKNLPRESTILPPPVDIASFHSSEKKNIIISVGRFFPWLHSKKQEILVQAFKNLCRKGLGGWRLYLLGKTEKGSQGYLEKIKREAKGYPIEIIPDATFQKLVEIYSQAKIYWHATGFGEDLIKHPEKGEHFGITTVEAMAAGCVPLVFYGGAQPEIVNGRDACLWKSLEELEGKTLNLINNRELWENLSKESQKRSRDFSQEEFFRRLDEVFK